MGHVSFSAVLLQTRVARQRSRKFEANRPFYFALITRNEKTIFYGKKVSTINQSSLCDTI